VAEKRRVQGTGKLGRDVKVGDTIIAIGGKGHGRYIPERMQSPIASIRESRVPGMLTARKEDGDQLLFPADAEVRIK
jgi:hypothetical protein